MTQQRVLSHLEDGHSISTLEAEEEFGVKSLSRTITALRKKGHQIKSTIGKTPDGTEYTTYRMVR